jgi:DNA-binding transcriptional regulator LsrR (DeoR family)
VEVYLRVFLLPPKMIQARLHPTREKTVSKQERDITPYEITKAFYDLPYHRRRFKSVIDRLDIDCKNLHGCEHKLSEKVKQWEEARLVTHLVLRRDEPYLPRVPSLENDVRRRFGLRGVIVVDISSLSTPDGTPYTNRNAWNEFDDRTHRQLGVWGGRLLSSVLRPSDVIATGGGRGPYFTAQNCFVCTDSRYYGDVVALTGQISAHEWKQTVGLPAEEPRYLDADHVASFLHFHLSMKGAPRLLNCSITERRRLRTKDVTVALIGIGALGGGHRLTEYKQLEDVRSVQDLLCSINQKAQAIEKSMGVKGPHFHHPVGDVCNWYFLVNSRPTPLSLKDARNLQALIDQLNEKFLNTTPDDLTRISEKGIVIAVAGGPHKAAAVRYVLQPRKGKPWITHLVTDHRIARELVGVNS